MATPMRSALSSTVRSGSLNPARCLTNFSVARASMTQSALADNTPLSDPSELPQSLQHNSKPTKLPSRSHNTYFDTTAPRKVAPGGDKPPDPNKASLGKTLTVLQDRLPTLLQSPLPQHILAPNISLHLFPSTHPHLPTVSGRVAYNAALWTSPIAWNRVPIIGNVKIEILAERMTSEPITFLPRRPGAIPEQLIVRWCEKRKVGNADESGSSIARSIRFRGSSGVDPNKAFTGLFIFDFDSEGRILSHTIETAQQSGSWGKGVGAKFVGLTDWLLGGIRDPGGGTPVPLFERVTKPS